MPLVKDVIFNLPRKTLEYFATTYVGIGFTQVLDMSDDDLIHAIQDAGMATRVGEIYTETCDETDRKKSDYHYYVKPYGQDEMVLVAYDKVIEAFDECFLFGKAIFILFLTLGTMETASEVFLAKKIKDEE